MKILELNIVEFGCLSNRKITLGDKLNIISGSNESGKSTVMLFIRFMLYGLPARRSARSSDRERALNWETKRAAGTMLLESGGKKYFVERRAVSSGTKLNESLKLTDFTTGEEIKAEPGEFVLGVPSDVFDNSCFIEQMKAGDINRVQTASAIENMLASADESIDVSDILERLDKVRKEYKHNRGDGGKIYETEQKIMSLRIKERNLAEKYTSFTEQSAELARKSATLEQISASLKKSKEKAEQIAKGQILLRFAALDEKKAELESKKAELSELCASVTKEGFTPDAHYAVALRSGARDLKEAMYKHSTLSNEYRKACESTSIDDHLCELGEHIENAGGKANYLAAAFKKSARSKAFSTVGCICVGLSVPTALAIIALHTFPIIPIVLATLSAVLIAAGVALFASAANASKAIKSLLSELGVSLSEANGYADKCLAELAKKRERERSLVASKALIQNADEDILRYRVRLTELLLKTATKVSDDNDEIINEAMAEARLTETFCQRHTDLSGEILALGAVIKNDSDTLAAYDQDALRQSVDLNLSAITPELIASVKKAYEFDEQRYSILAGQVSHLRENVAALRGGLSETPTEIADEIRALEEKLEKDSAYYFALALAKTHIEAASIAMSGNVTPQISRQAGELLSSLSDGKHAFMQTTKNLDLSIEEGGFTASIDQFSGGTQDAAYICLRIALMLRLFGTEIPPLLLDESLCQMDDTRAKNMLSVLSKIAETTTQCIIFTCHSREKLACDELGIDVTLTQM